jgi:dephospho-CoA kinase
MIIGITGPSGSRKTSVVKHLAKRHGFARLHAGMPVKKGFRVGFGLSPEHTSGRAKDNATMLLGGAITRAAMEASGYGIHQAAPNATSAVMQRRIARRMSKYHDLVVDGIRSPVEAATLRRLGGVIVRCDNGKEPDPNKPLDQLQSTIVADQSVDTSGNKKARKAAADQMLADLCTESAK